MLRNALIGFAATILVGAIFIPDMRSLVAVSVVEGFTLVDFTRQVSEGDGFTLVGFTRHVSEEGLSRDVAQPIAAGLIVVLLGVAGIIPIGEPRLERLLFGWLI